MHGGRHGFPGFIIVERRVPVIIEKQVVIEKPVAAAASPPPAPRKPYVVGSTYASLPPQGCMKLVELAASYYFCGGGEWYRQVGDGPSARYKAVARKL